MTDLSPAQKALAAFNERHELCGPFDDDWAEQCLAAALEDVADEVVPWETWLGTDETCYAYYRQRCNTRRQLLAIAAELRGGTTTTETP